MSFKFKNFLVIPFCYFIFRKYHHFTMISRNTYIKNLILCYSLKHLNGDVVECGTWRGGMIAGIADILGPNRTYFLLDSFEGLPEPDINDGIAALEYTKNKSNKFYHDNCSSPLEVAEKAIKLSKAKDFKLIKGWFENTLPMFDKDRKIAILRLDADWYDSTMTCLDNLYDLVEENGIILFDDYYIWEGCSKAVHDFLSKRNLSVRINQFDNNIAFIQK